VASHLGHYQIVELLITKGANVNQTDFDDESPLISAARNNKLDVVRLLIERGTHLHFLNDVIAGDNYEVTELLLQNGADPDTMYGGSTPLGYHSWRGHKDLVRLLIEYGADVNLAANQHGETPLQLAFKARRWEVATALLDNGANVQDVVTQLNQMDASERTVLLLSIKDRYIGIAQQLIQNDPQYQEVVNHVDTAGRSALMRAIMHGNISLAQLLIENGANVNHLGPVGHDALIEASIVGHPGIVRLLIEKGANVNHTNLYGTPALIHSIEHGHYDVSILLVDSGADVDRLFGGFSAIWRLVAVGYDLPHKHELVRIMILAGAKTDGITGVLYDEYVSPITGPIEQIKRVAATVGSKNPLQALADLSTAGISYVQGLISSAFESHKIGVKLFENSEVVEHLVKNLDWNESRIKLVASIISELVDLECTDVNVFYHVAPFIGNADEEMLKHTETALKFLTRSYTLIASTFATRKSVTTVTGPILNEMIHRSFRVGFRPVVKAIFTIYWEEVKAQKYLESRLPEDTVSYIRGHVNPSLGIYGRNFRERALKMLAISTKRHSEEYPTTTTEEYPDTTEQPKSNEY
jgi:ankyrin repeat protein